MTNTQSRTPGSERLSYLSESIDRALRVTWSQSNADRTAETARLFGPERPDYISEGTAAGILADNEADATVHRLTDVLRWQRELDKLAQIAVDADRAEGATWAEVGAALGISRQAAQQRYGRPERR